MDDPLLIRQVLAGNRNAFRFLVLRYQRAVFGQLGALGLPASVVEELAQEAFLRAFDRLADYDPAKGASFATWLLTIARNLAEHARARKGYRLESPRDEFGSGGQASLLADERGDPEAQLGEREKTESLHRAVASLPEQFRTALTLSYLRELSLEEIAELESCSVGTVKSRIFRAKGLLRAVLAAPDGSERGST